MEGVGGGEKPVAGAIQKNSISPWSHLTGENWLGYGGRGSQVRAISRRTSAEGRVTGILGP